VSRLGTALIVVGLLALGYSGLWQLGLAPGSRVSLPPPVALEQRARAAPPRPAEAAPLATPAGVLEAPPALATPAPLAAAATPAGVPTPAPAPAHLAPADAADRDAAEAPPGYAVRLAIPAIKLDTPVQQGGIVPDAQGDPIWETRPFVAVHYGDLTALIGQHSNAVIAGHVVTLNEGNVFRFLYQLDIDDQVQVWDDHQREHDYHVVDVRLVPPTDTSVMDATPDETLTLITCGGTFDPVKREFSDRLIVVAKPL
jgi:LPXTG-site transpeptidase (sortase) family protein